MTKHCSRCRALRKRLSETSNALAKVSEANIGLRRLIKEMEALMPEADRQQVVQRVNPTITPAKPVEHKDPLILPPM